MTKFYQGEKVLLIVGGIYKRHWFGMYVGPYGTKIVTVNLDGDPKQEERNI
jgi:hypothetical protein